MNIYKLYDIYHIYYIRESCKKKQMKMKVHLKRASASHLSNESPYSCHAQTSDGIRGTAEEFPRMRKLRPMFAAVNT